MLKNKTVRYGTIATAALILVAGAAIAQSANAVSQTNGSQAPVYVMDGGTDVMYGPTTPIAWTTDVYAVVDNTNTATPYVCPADATGAVTFLAPKGVEATKTSWSASATGGFAPGTKNVVQFTSSLYAQNSGNAAAVKASGGDFSVGLACTKANGVSLASTGLWFASIHITAGTGSYLVDQPVAVAPSVTPTPTPVPTGAVTAPLALKATTTAAQDGTLGLTAPSNSTVLIGSPVVDPTTHLSTSTGTLGNVTVADGRIVTHAGWNLTTSVSNFVLEGDSTKIIPNTQLGFAPALVSSPANATGILASAAQVAGSAVYSAGFASADNGANVGNTVVNATLKFIAPVTAVAGTYDSTLTLTLVSK